LARIHQRSRDFRASRDEVRLLLEKNLSDACPGLKFIGRGGVGIDNIDKVYAESKGVKVFQYARGRKSKRCRIGDVADVCLCSIHLQSGW
jgi:lactate dehydrogenase-like 2-hydroxyacid dehydrogenase